MNTLDVLNLNLDDFIKSQITGREESLFAFDINQYQEALHQKINHKKVLVIGGAGTIGSSFIKAILPFGPKALCVVDTNENGLTELVRDLRSASNDLIPSEFNTYPVNFGDPVFYKILEKWGPFEIVANFAAHKHVRSEKDVFSVEAMIENNVFKTQQLLDYLCQQPPEHFFGVSTDKAANPVSVMGASKKVMEDVILSYADKMPVSTARFANVAFSNGSLLFGYLERLFKRQPLVSPSDIRRYFVSPEESGQLCMLACVLGETGDIFFPNLDPEKDMKKFSDICIDFLYTLGYEPQICASEEEARSMAQKMASDSKIYPVFQFKSDTSGEKPYEEFYNGSDELNRKAFKALGIIKNAKRKQRSEIAEIILSLKALFNQSDITKKDIVGALSQYLTDFQHIEKGKNLDQKM